METFRTVYTAEKLQLLAITFFDWLCHTFLNHIILIAYIRTYRCLQLHYLQRYFNINVLQITSIFSIVKQGWKTLQILQGKSYPPTHHKVWKNVFGVLLISVNFSRGENWLLWGGSRIQVPTNFYLILRVSYLSEATYWEEHVCFGIFSGEGSLCLCEVLPIFFSTIHIRTRKQSKILPGITSKQRINQ